MWPRLAIWDTHTAPVFDEREHEFGRLEGRELVQMAGPLCRYVVRKIRRPRWSLSTPLPHEGGRTMTVCAMCSPIRTRIPPVRVPVFREPARHVRLRSLRRRHARVAWAAKASWYWTGA